MVREYNPISCLRSLATFVVHNIGTILVALVLLAVVLLIIRKLVKDKKAGKSSCGCDCSHCGMCESCHKR